ncbi:MAG: 3-hydroxyacyl-ACP dehydratase FabZ [Lachnospiraceae bacterium]|nr:3-hydroxyacyl-ACP dehydratase FabZ [Lachnospiraceae bacterium]
MNKEELMNILPHRDDMLLIDEAEVKDGVAYGKRKITGEEFFLRGHFPGNPIVPGVIQCEILAQSACVLFADQAQDGKITTLFTGLEKVRFKNPVKPGDVFETECSIIKSKGPFYWAKGTGKVNGKLCVSAEFSFAIFPAEEEKA